MIASSRSGWRAATSSMTTASRPTGVAPLAVFFDAVEASNGVVQPSDGDYGALYYQWDFGDPASGTWSTNGKSKNRATGYVAAHVFEDPGTYVVTLQVITPDRETHNYQQEITVHPFAGTTYYVASNVDANGNPTGGPEGSDSNSGLSPSVPFKTFAKAMSMVATNTRILFKRGDAWTISSGKTITAAGPGIVGAYGEDTASKPALHVYDSTTYVFRPTAADWRIMDLELAGHSTASLRTAVDGGMGNCQQWLLLGLEIHGFATGVGNTKWPQGFSHDHIFVVDCELHDNGSTATPGNNMYLGGSHLAFLGNRCERVRFLGEHILRVWDAVKCVISSNILRDPMWSKGSLKLHARKWNDSDLGRDSKDIVISDNRFRGDQWPCVIGPQDHISLEVIRNVVVERNIIEPNPRTVVGFPISAQDVTVRNNTGDGTSSGMTLVVFFRRGMEPAPDRARVYNNTIYRGDAGTVTCCRIRAGTGSRVVNNFAANADGSAIAFSSTVQVTHDNNFTSTSPAFRSMDPYSSNFLELTANSTDAIDKGDRVPVYDDFMGPVFEDLVNLPRPFSFEGEFVYDVGAYELAP